MILPVRENERSAIYIIAYLLVPRIDDDISLYVTDN